MYEWFIHKLYYDNIIISHINKEYKCDAYFPYRT